MKGFLFPLLFAIAIAPTELFATNADETSQTISKPDIRESMVIIGTQGGQIDAVPGSAHFLDAKELDKHSFFDGHKSLRKIPGVNIHEEEGFGLFPQIGLRGTRIERSTRVTLMEDNILAAPAPYSDPAAYYLAPMARMHRIEVRKGSAAIKYGPYTTGGAINLLSTPVPDKSSAHASYALGSFGGKRQHAWAGSRWGQFSWLLEAISSESTGFKKLDQNLYEGKRMPKANTGFDRANYLAKLKWNTDSAAVYQEVELKFSHENVKAKETYLGLTLQDFKASPYRRYAGSQFDEINSEHQQMTLRHFISPSPKLDLTTNIYRNDFARNWYKLHEVQNEAGGSFTSIANILKDPEGNSSAMSWIYGEPNSELLGNVRANNRTYISQGIQTKINYDFSSDSISQNLELGIRYHEDQSNKKQWQDSYRMNRRQMTMVREQNASGAEGNISSGIPGSQENGLTESKATAIYLENTIAIQDLTLIPGLRHESIKTTSTTYASGDSPNRDTVVKKQSKSTQAFLPGLGTTYKINPNTLLLAGVHRGFAPTGSDKKIPDEKSTNYEAGARFHNQALKTELIGFFTHYQNLVGRCTASTGGSCNVGDEFSAGKVDVMGLEFNNSYDFGKAFDSQFKIPVALAYSWTDSRFNSSFKSSFEEWGDVHSGYKLPQIPEHQINLSLGINDPNAWSLNLNSNYVSETRTVAGKGSIPDNQKVDSRIIYDLSGEVYFHNNGRIYANIENLSNESYVVAARPAGYRPGAPRSVWTGVKLDL